MQNPSLRRIPRGKVATIEPDAASHAAWRAATNPSAIIAGMTERDLKKAALRGEPSYVWREGQERRLKMIADYAGARLKGRVLDDGCGVGMYVKRLEQTGARAVGLEYDFERARLASANAPEVLNAASERLPFASGNFDLVLSHEVIEHVRDDRAAIREMSRVLRAGGRAIIFCPNRGYPFETHGIYWRGRYRFGNIPFVNYLPRALRDRLAPHVRVYSAGDLERLLAGAPVRVVQRTVIFGAYDNIVARFGVLGRVLRAVVQALESTPLRIFGLSHFWVFEKLG
jgi:SAM-dependent methyltransferase